MPATLQKQNRRAPVNPMPASPPNGRVLPALVHLHRGVPVTDSQSIAREFGRRHDNVMQSIGSLIADDTINRLDFKEVEYTDAKGERRRAIELTERGALIAMPFIGGRNSRAGQARLVDAFMSMRVQLAERITTGWAEARREVAANYAVVAEMLAMRREAEGKETKAHHYTNEVRLINFAFAGKFGPLDRGSLSHSELHILNRLQIRDSALIGVGKPYDERKVALVTYAAELRAAQPRRLSRGGSQLKARNSVGAQRARLPNDESQAPTSAGEA
ncbi:Rha family transcriptional regulator [Cupriavidus basilensis]|uniref:Putative anti-repressor protein n=1 Tax=Cupriavidus basilensis TaxID=68895 RepID=A0A0C4YEB6_9BURK|nr:Rha family transcriptional regulator [Cupriavidus basilensis]AJG21105.1 putative anti-repressor protein [Cupriavidus basilensis]